MKTILLTLVFTVSLAVIAYAACRTFVVIDPNGGPTKIYSECCDDDGNCTVMCVSGC